MFIVRIIYNILVFRSYVCKSYLSRSIFFLLRAVIEAYYEKKNKESAGTNVIILCYKWSKFMRAIAVHVKIKNM